MRLDFLSLFSRNKKIADQAMREAKQAQSAVSQAIATAQQAETNAANAAQSASSVKADIDQIRNTQEMPGAPGKSVELRMDPSNDGVFQIRREGGTDADWIPIRVKGESGQAAEVKPEDIQKVIDQNPNRFQGPAPSHDQLNASVTAYMDANADQFKGIKGEDGVTPSQDSLSILIKDVIKANPEQFKGDKGDMPTVTEFSQAIENVINANPDQFKGPKGDLPSTTSITNAIQSVINANPDQFKGLKGDIGNKGDSPSNAALTTLIQNVINTNPDQFKGLKGDIGPKGDSPYVAYVATAATGLASVSFPSGRFTKPPRIVVQPYSPAADAFTYWAEVMESTTGTVSPTISGCNIRVRRQPTGIVSSLVNLVLNDEPKKAINVVVIAYDQ